MDATAQAELVRAGELTATELVGAAIERVEALNPTLNAVVSTTYEEALARAAELDLRKDDDRGTFAGVPFLLKDLVIERAGTPFTEGSRSLLGNVSTMTSELALRLERAGLIVLGRTNTPEFGLTPTCESLLHGPARNPWSTGHSTSGSSGGSAAAVAAGLVPMAHGNDVGGSIRYPASACALFGLKPTRARNPLGPLYGDVAAGMGVEHALTRTVRDSALLLDLTAGPAPGDPYPAPPLVRPLHEEVGVDPGRLRIAVSTRRADGRPTHPECQVAADQAVALLAGLGHEVVEADLPGLTADVGHAIGIMFDALSAWVAAFWASHRGRAARQDEFEPLTWAYTQAGHRVSAGDYLQAVETIQRFSRTVAGFLTTYDVFLTPTMSAPPAPIGWITSTPDDPYRALKRGGDTVAYAGVVANLTGNPAMSVPMTWTAEGLPMGVHVLGRFGDEATLIRLAAQVEAARPWVGRLPPVHATRCASSGTDQPTNTTQEVTGAWQ
jgi:amidase